MRSQAPQSFSPEDVAQNLPKPRASALPSQGGAGQHLHYLSPGALISRFISLISRLLTLITGLSPR